jgi:hypothetical protein
LVRYRGEVLEELLVPIGSSDIAAKVSQWLIRLLQSKNIAKSPKEEASC